MTPRQSNIIFYTVHFICRYRDNNRKDHDPGFFDDFTKSKEELLLKEAVNKGDHNQALTSYQILLKERISDGNEIDAETAIMYEDMAKSYALLGNNSRSKEPLFKIFKY